MQTGWFADENVFDMQIERYRPHRSARRFDAGTPPVPNIYAGVAGVGLIAEAGVPAIQAHVRGLVERLVAGLDEVGATGRRPAARPARLHPLHRRTRARGRASPRTTSSPPSATPTSASRSTSTTPTRTSTPFSPRWRATARCSPSRPTDVARELSQSAAACRACRIRCVLGRSSGHDRLQAAACGDRDRRAPRRCRARARGMPRGRGAGSQARPACGRADEWTAGRARAAWAAVLSGSRGASERVARIDWRGMRLAARRRTESAAKPGDAPRRPPAGRSRCLQAQVAAGGAAVAAVEGLRRRCVATWWVRAGGPRPCA